MSSATSTPKGIIFDLDGTLYHMRWYMRPLFFLALFPHGGRLPAYMKVREQFSGREMGDAASLMKGLSSVLAGRLGISEDAARAWINGPFYEKFVAILPHFRHDRPGLQEALKHVRGRGIRCAVLSDFGRIRERLAQLRIDAGLFDPIVSSEECGALKPATRPFAMIAEAWGLACGEILVVGDRDDTDGEAARACGMQFRQLKEGEGLSWREMRSWLVAI